MKKYIVICILTSFLFAIFPTFIIASEKSIYSLDEVKELVLKNSRTIKSMEQRVKEVEAQKYLASNAYDSARYGGYYNALHSKNQVMSALAAKELELKEEMDKGAAANPDIIASLQYQIQMLQAQAGQSVMAVEQTAGMSSQAKKGYEAAKDGLADIKQAQEELEKQLEYIVEQMYTGILLLENQTEYMSKNYNQLLNMLNLERIKKELGMASDVEVEQLAAQTSEVGRAVDQMQENLKLTKWTLNDMMGRELDSKLELVQFNVDPYIPIGTADSYIERALENAYFIPQLKRDIKTMNKDLDDLDGSNEQAVQKAKIEQTKLTLEGKKQDLKNTVASLVNDVNIKGRAYQLADYSFNTAQKAYEWDKIKYELGMLSKIMFDGSELAYQEALNKKTSAGYDYFLAKRALELAEQGILVTGQ